MCYFSNKKCFGYKLPKIKEFPPIRFCVSISLVNQGQIRGRNDRMPKSDEEDIHFTSEILVFLPNLNLSKAHINGNT